MARTVKDARLETRTARAALKPAGKPYYRTIDEGLHLGYRKNQTGGKWVMRCYIGRRYSVETIGTADDVLDPDGAIVLSFAQAQALIRRRFVEDRRLFAGLPAQAPGPYTVRDCLTEYLAWVRENRKSVRDVGWRMEGFILPALGDVACAKLTAERLRAWHSELAKQPPRIRTGAGQTQRYRAFGPAWDAEQIRRRRGTSNRTLTTLKAALNRAWRDGKIPSDSAWRMVAPFRQTGAARARVLTIAECQRLINASTPDFRRLVQAALATGARFGELVAFEVSDFNANSGTVHVRDSKGGRGRHIVLTEEGVALLAGFAVGRDPDDRLLVKANGSRWWKAHQTRPMHEACSRAGIIPAASFHALRHTYASLTIMSGAPLIVVARNLGHADTKMVEAHYGHLTASYLADEIRRAAPRFGFEAEGTVMAITKRAAQ